MEGPADVPGMTASEEVRVEGLGNSVYLWGGGIKFDLLEYVVVLNVCIGDMMRRVRLR